MSLAYISRVVSPAAGSRPCVGGVTPAISRRASGSWLPGSAIVDNSVAFKHGLTSGGHVLADHLELEIVHPGLTCAFYQDVEDNVDAYLLNIPG